MLVRRVAATCDRPVRIPMPMRIPRSKLIREAELERAAQLVRRLHGPDVRLLLTFDADDDCPAALAPSMRARLRQHASDLPASVVLATRELEAWFLAGVESLRGYRGLRADAEPPAEVERLRDAKGQLARLMTRSYSEVTDPPAFAARLDLELARRRSPSFDKFLRDVERLLRGEP